MERRFFTKKKQLYELQNYWFNWHELAGRPIAFRRFTGTQLLFCFFKLHSLFSFSRFFSVLIKLHLDLFYGTNLFHYFLSHSSYSSPFNFLFLQSMVYIAFSSFATIFLENMVRLNINRSVMLFVDSFNAPKFERKVNLWELHVKEFSSTRVWKIPFSTMKDSIGQMGKRYRGGSRK